MKRYTVVQDWISDWWDSGADDVRCTDEPQVFHVIADNASDASDAANAQAVERFGADAAEYLSAVVVFHGHATPVKDGE